MNFTLIVRDDAIEKAAGAALFCYPQITQITQIMLLRARGM
jgi:hypothetical protein